MKKLIVLFSLLLFIASFAKAQSCKCNPNGFGPFVHTYNGVNTTVRTGHQFKAKCKTPITLTSSYKCSYTTEICEAKLKAVIKNSAGGVVKTYEEFSFPWAHEFETAGSYVLEIIPYCFGKACPAAKFYFTVTCDDESACKCNGIKGWQELFTVTDGKVKPANCGETFTIKKVQKFGLKGTFKCIGGCEAILKGTITNIDNGTTQNFPTIRLDGVPLNLAGGKYKLIITPVCGGKECESCVIYVTVI